MEVKCKTDGVKFNGHRGGWYLVDTEIYNGEVYALFESEIGGDEWPGIVARVGLDGSLTMVLDDCWNGFLDLEEEFGY